MPRKPYRRLRPSGGRLLQSIWQTIRRRRQVSAPALAEATSASESYTRHVLARLAREGLAIRIEERGTDAGGQWSPAVYQLGRDIGPVAPILIGGLAGDRVGRGITDPNRQPKEPRRRRS